MANTIDMVGSAYRKTTKYGRENHDIGATRLSKYPNNAVMLTGIIMEARTIRALKITALMPSLRDR